MMPQANSSTNSPSIAVLPLVGLAALLLALVGGGYLVMSANPRNGYTGNTEESEQPFPDEGNPVPFDKWDKPVVAMVVSGQMHGYIDPCGCTDPQYGGLPRRYNFIQSLKAKKWDVVGIDLGELPATKGIHEQNLLKYRLSVDALALMDYKVIGIGRDELLTPLGEALARIWEKNRSFPRPVNLSMAEAAPGGDFHKEFNLRQYEIIQAANVKIGVINMMGPDLRSEFKGKEKFLANQHELPKALDEFAKAGVDIGVVMQHEYPKLDSVKFPVEKFPVGGLKWLLAVEDERYDQAKKCAEFCAEARSKNPKIPPVQLMSVLVHEPEPPATLKQLDNKLPTRVVEIGHKGKYVGLVGVYRDKKGNFQVRYQKVLMGPEYKSDPVKELDNPVIKLMTDYHGELKRQDMLDKFVRMPHANQTAPNVKGLTAKYVGSNACKNCHKEAFKIWENSGHSHGTETLEDVKKERPPFGREFDPECMRCHTTGFEHPGGYDHPVPNLAAWKPGQRPALQPGELDDHNKKLRGIGCESCHGPGSEHIKIVDVRDPNPMERMAINPYRPSDEERKLENQPGPPPAFKKLFEARMNALNRLCIQCHDHENDVNWLKDGIEKRWIDRKIVHRTPPQKGGAPAKGDEPPRINIGEPRPVVKGADDKK